MGGTSVSPDHTPKWEVHVQSDSNVELADTNNVLEEFWKVERSSFLNGGDDSSEHFFLARPFVLNKNK